MADNWFFVNDYQPTPTEINKALADIHNTLETITRKVESNETILMSIESKLDKLIDSHKNMINYFHAMENNGVRQLNYKIRAFTSGTAPPIPFKPEHLQHD